MFGWDEAQQSHQEVYGAPEEHRGKFSHEVLAGGAAFEGMKLYEDHQRKEGKVVSHQFAKELLVGFVGGEVEKLAETKGMDAYDRERTHHQATQSAQGMYDQHYQRDLGADDYNPNQYGPPDRLNYDNNNY